MRYVGSNWGTLSFTVPYVYEVRRIYSLLEWNFTWGGFNELRIQLLVASKVQVQVVALRPNVSTKVSKAPTRKEFRQGPPEPWLLAKCPNLGSFFESAALRTSAPSTRTWNLPPTDWPAPRLLALPPPYQNLEQGTHSQYSPTNDVGGAIISDLSNQIPYWIQTSKPISDKDSTKYGVSV